MAIARKGAAHPKSGVVQCGGPEGGIAWHLIPPGIPARSPPAREQLEAGTGAAALDDGVLLLRLVGVLLHGRVQPGALAAAADGCPAARAEEQVLGLRAQVLAHAVAR